MAIKSEDRCLRVSIVKDRLGCSTSNVYKLIEAGQLQAVSVGAKKGLRVRESELARFLKVREG